MESLEPWLIRKEETRPSTSGSNLASCRTDMSPVSSATRMKC